MTDQPPVLTDGVVTLRAHRLDDVTDLVIMADDPEFVRHTTVPAPYTEQDALDRIEHVRAGIADGAGMFWAIEAPDGDRARFAGQVDVRPGPPPEVGFGLAPWARGRGFMSRALRLAAGWAFTEAGHPILHWAAHAGNLASWRVAHACGFSFDGERPLALPHRGRLVDGWFASLRPGVAATARTTWWDVPVVEGDRVRLRPLGEDDVPRLVEACSDPTITWYLAHIPDPYTEDDARRWITQVGLDAALGRAVAWAIADRADDRLLGQVSVFRLDDVYQPVGGEIGYWGHPDARGRGVIREGAALAVAHAFRPRADGGLGRARLQLGASAENAGSRGIAERLGFTFLGIHHRDGVVGRGADRRPDDGAWYEMVRDP